MFKPTDFFELNHSIAQTLFKDSPYIWSPLARINDFITILVGGKQTFLGTVMDGAYISDKPIYIGEGARIEPGAYILGPAYIGKNVVVRHGAYVRENVIMLDGSLIGHASEAKNSIFFPKAQAPHFNYVGDSILGNGVNLGAGTKLSNLGIMSEKDPVTGKRPTIKIQHETDQFDTGLTKLGAIMGDHSQTGCNAVLNPGALVAPNVLVYANLSLRKGYHGPNSIIKLRQKTSRVPMRNQKRGK